MVLVEEFRNSFLKTAAGSNIERVWKKISILWYMQKHLWNYFRKLNLQWIYWEGFTYDTTTNNMMYIISLAVSLRDK